MAGPDARTRDAWPDFDDPEVVEAIDRAAGRMSAAQRDEAIGHWRALDEALSARQRAVGNSAMAVLEAIARLLAWVSNILPEADRRAALVYAVLRADRLSGALRVAVQSASGVVGAETDIEADAEAERQADPSCEAVVFVADDVGSGP